MAKTIYPGIPYSPETIITIPISATDTVITLLDTDGLPPAPNLASLGEGTGGETVRYNGKTATTLTGVERGFEGSARPWGINTVVARRWTNYDYEALIENQEECIEESDFLLLDGSTY